MKLISLARFAVLMAAATLPIPVFAASPALEVGSAAPPLELTAADGRQRSLAEIEGPTVLIFFRGLW